MITKPPMDLTLRGRRLWDEMLGHLRAYPWFDVRLDGDALATWCQLQADAEALEHQVATEGRVQTDGTLHPALEALHQTRALALEYAAALGLTPLSRARIQATSQNPEPWEDNE